MQQHTYDNLAGVAEAAELFNVTKQVIANWKARYKDFPKPYATLAMGTIFLKSDLVAWGVKTGRLN